jgi:hypothetical protein
VHSTSDNTNPRRNGAPASLHVRAVVCSHAFARAMTNGDIVLAQVYQKALRLIGAHPARFDDASPVQEAHPK